MENHIHFSKCIYPYIFICFLFTIINPIKSVPLVNDKPINICNNCNLAAPSHAVAVKINSYSASVKWNAVEGNAGYYIQIFGVLNGTLGFVPIQQFEQQDTSTLFTNLVSGRTYKIVIRTICPSSRAIGLRNDYSNATVVYAVVQDDIVFSQRPQNPFSNQINLTYEIAQAGNVSMGIFDGNGHEIIPILKNEYKEQGTYNTDIKTEGVNPGMYYLNYKSGQTVRTLKLLKIQ